MAHVSMRNRYLPALLLALAVCAMLPVSARANPLKDPKRMLNGQTVSLVPLFHWWTNHAGSRPLTAWVRVTGRVVATNSWGWVVEAQVEHTQSGSDGGARRVLLRHPPLADLAEFERLSSRMHELNQQHTAIADEQTALQNQASAVKKEQSAYRKSGLRNRGLSRENRVIKAEQNQAKAEMKPVDQQIQELKKQLAAFPNPDHYEVDCFALHTGEEHDHFPLYDHGGVLK